MSDRIAFTGTMETEGRRIRGSVKLAGARTFRNGEWVEVDPAALMKASAANTIARWDHDPAKVLGRVSNNTLTVTRTPDGIDFETAELPHTTYADDALELVRGGYAGGSSFEIEGLRSHLSTDPTDGLRVRRYTSIKTLVDVSPVIDPAFASVASAFSKESEVTEIIEEPVVPAPAPAAPAATFTAEPAKSDVFETAAAFAKKQDLAGLEAAMDSFIKAGIDSPANGEAYQAFAAEYDRRSATNGTAKERAEAIKLAHMLRTGKLPKAPESSETFGSEDYSQAFSQYLRSGNPRLMEQFAQTVAGDGTQGGFAVPDGFLNRIVERLKAYGGVSKVAETITTSSGESLRWPYNDDTGNSAAIATEATKVASGGADKVLSNIELGAFEYDATGTGNNPLELSLPLIQDAAFDVAAWIERNLATRIGRKQAVDFANGAGSTEPVGLFTKSADVMTATAVSLAIPEHILQVDGAYRELGNSRWLLSDTTLLKIWQSQTTTGVPLIIPGGTIAGRPEDTLWGYPMTNDPAAGTKVAFGDFSLGYIIRRVRDIQMLVDPYTTGAKRTVSYHAWARADGNIQDPYAYSVSEWSTVSADT